MSDIKEDENNKLYYHNHNNPPYPKLMMGSYSSSLISRTSSYRTLGENDGPKDKIVNLNPDSTCAALRNTFQTLTSHWAKK